MTSILGEQETLQTILFVERSFEGRNLHVSGAALKTLRLLGGGDTGSQVAAL